jgi:hypothetical protein
VLELSFVEVDPVRTSEPYNTEPIACGLMIIRLNDSELNRPDYFGLNRAGHAGASVTRSHLVAKRERCSQPLQFVVVLPPRMDTSLSSRNRRMSQAVSSKPSASFPS